jgi:hypothetical protein
MAIFVANALWATTRWVRNLVVGASCLVFAGSAAFAGLAFHQSCAPEDSVGAVVESFRAGKGAEGTDEYAPPAADDSLVATDLPAACLMPNPLTPLGGGDPDLTPEWTPEQGSCQATFAFDLGGGPDRLLHKRVRATAPKAGFLVLRLREYPAWTVRVNGNPVHNRPIRQDGLMAVPVPAGTDEISVDWTTTPDVRLGRWISLITLLLVTALGLLLLRRSQPKLKCRGCPPT